MKPEKFSAEQVADALRDSHGLISSAARLLHCPPRTVYNYIDRYPTVRAAREEAREKTLDVAELSLFKQITNGNISAIIFYLKTQGKRRGYIERVENVNYAVDPALLKQALDLAEKRGINASDLFNSMIAELSEDEVEHG